MEAQQQKARLAKKGQAPKAFPRVALDLATTVERIQQNFVISDPSIPDCPIVFASEGFLDMVGYPRSEVLGRNCRFLQVWPPNLRPAGAPRIPVHDAVGHRPPAQAPSQGVEQGVLGQWVAGHLAVLFILPG